MVSKVRIKNFKSVVDLELELGKVNVFIGENGCGKTNILEAITCLGVSTINGSFKSVQIENIIQLSTSMMSLRGIRGADSYLLRSAFSPSFSEQKNVDAKSEPFILCENSKNERSA